MRDKKVWKHELRVPLHVKTVQSKKGGVTNTKEIIILK